LKITSKRAGDDLDTKRKKQKLSDSNSITALQEGDKEENKVALKRTSKRKVKKQLQLLDVDDQYASDLQPEYISPTESPRGILRDITHQVKNKPQWK